MNALPHDPWNTEELTTLVLEAAAKNEARGVYYTPMKLRAWETADVLVRRGQLRLCGEKADGEYRITALGQALLNRWVRE